MRWRGSGRSRGCRNPPRWRHRGKVSGDSAGVVEVVGEGVVLACASAAVAVVGDVYRGCGAGSEGDSELVGDVVAGTDARSETDDGAVGVDG